jgi:septum formation protein
MGCRGAGAGLELWELDYDAPVRLVLASASPRRAELLLAAGFTFDTLAVDIDEAVLPGEDPAAYVRRLALEKSARAQAMLSLRHAGWLAEGTGAGTGAGEAYRATSHDTAVLGADTAVVVDGEILGKPIDGADAERMVRLISGRRHDVMTGVCLRHSDTELGAIERTIVDVAELSEADVAWYCASGEGRDKAGGYAIQGLASRFVTRIEGSYSNVVGLPITVVVRLLQRLASHG